ncbi:hypothetical protein KYB31_18635 [Clostridium felsineum]|uniref:hypothetical protein n=1 Tax=Clostridium felsineum TaxID=36839 RepID=UPI0009C5DA88|nr:hypothetical protein [Clostridium felsineum]MCR3760994.1 hypothetical protein [Clostridium felsineum]URZ02392.1 hypothetical protein CLAUR_023890 [Clostridium felsineum]URZ18185.1 hypothetical protein CLFE_042400 [Clostridium felsineum DSM 794]
MFPKRSNKFILVFVLCTLVLVSAFTLNTCGTHKLLSLDPSLGWNISKFIF